jgi:hypothetical protein
LGVPMMDDKRTSDPVAVLRAHRNHYRCPQELADAIDAVLTRLAEEMQTKRKLAGLVADAEARLEEAEGDLAEVRRVRSIWYDKWSKAEAKRRDDCASRLSAEARERELHEALRLKCDEYRMHDPGFCTSGACDLARAALASTGPQ